MGASTDDDMVRMSRAMMISRALRDDAGPSRRISQQVSVGSRRLRWVCPPQTTERREFECLHFAGWLPAARPLGEVEPGVSDSATRRENVPLAARQAQVDPCSRRAAGAAPARSPALLEKLPERARFRRRAPLAPVVQASPAAPPVTPVPEGERVTDSRCDPQVARAGQRDRGGTPRRGLEGVWKVSARARDGVARVRGEALQRWRGLVAARPTPAIAHRPRTAHNY